MGRHSTLSVGQQMIESAVKRAMQAVHFAGPSYTPTGYRSDLMDRWGALRQEIEADMSARITRGAVIRHNARERARGEHVDVLAQRKPGETVQRQAAGRAQRAEAARQVVSLAVRTAFRGLYRTPGAKWAGGNQRVEVQFGAPSVVTETFREWSKNGKWSGMSCRQTITVPMGWIATVKDRGLAIVEGCLTLSVTPIACDSATEECVAATWIEQAAGVSLRAGSGVIYRRRAHAGAWYPRVHAASLRAARAVSTRQIAIARAEVA